MADAPGPKSARDAARGADLIVVGSGVAGLRAAIEAASAGLEVILLAKDPPQESATDKAQGGIAVALSDEDQVGLHEQDTIAAGGGLCDEKAVRTMVEAGPFYIQELIGWGAQFDREGSRLAFTREGAHSARRVLHAGGDSTGQEILRTLLRKAETFGNIRMLTGIYSVDLLVSGGACSGVICLEESTETLRAMGGRVLLATGGCGRIYRESSNPPQATGDGVAMAYRAGARLRDMEFVQFHPTSLAVEGAPRFLLSEALRGEGGLLRAAGGERFMTAVDPERAELAPRDVVSRAIFDRQAVDGPGTVGLDLTHLDPEFLKRRFPRIHATCLRYGVDMTRRPIPVSPSAHYLMGGVETDLEGRSSLPGLFAAGEVACTGVHGANRLASNSLLEGLVYGARAGAAAASSGGGEGPEATEPPLPSDYVMDAFEPGDAREAIATIRELSWSRIGIIRDGPTLASSLERIESLLGSAMAARGNREGVEARNMALVARLVAGAAIRRRESRGAHFRRDHPARDDEEFRVSFTEAVDGSVDSVRR